jgi:RHS repeat-associated protein
MMKIFLPILLIVLIMAQSAGAAEQVFFYHTDQAGTPLAMTDTSGTVVWKADYRPFGEEQSVDATIGNDKRFVGKEKDEETGLSYFGARYMDAKTGRFIAVDPVRAVDPKTSKTNERLLLNPQRLNTYAYALNNPYRFVDPDGKEAILMAIFANLLFGSTANAPEYRYSSTVTSQSSVGFAGEVALAETAGFVFGKALGVAINRTGLSLAEQAGMIQFTTHGAKQAAERGFTPERIARVMMEGKPVEAAGRYGPQIRYTLGENTVVVAKEGANANKVVTTYSPQTVNGIKGHWVEPK